MRHLGTTLIVLLGIAVLLATCSNGGAGNTQGLDQLANGERAAPPSTTTARQVPVQPDDAACAAIIGQAQRVGDPLEPGTPLFEAHLVACHPKSADTRPEVASPTAEPSLRPNLDGHARYRGPYPSPDTARESGDRDRAAVI